MGRLGDAEVKDQVGWQFMKRMVLMLPNRARRGRIFLSCPQRGTVDIKSC